MTDACGLCFQLVRPYRCGKPGIEVDLNIKCMQIVLTTRESEKEGLESFCLF